MIKQLQQFKILDFPTSKKETQKIYIDKDGNLYDLSAWMDAQSITIKDMPLFLVPNHISRTDSDFFLGLFSRKEMKQDSFKFLIIKSDRKEAVEEITSLLKDVLDESYNLHLNEENILFFSDKQNISIQAFINTISDDFGVNLQIFESPSVTREAFFVVYQLVEEFLSFSEFGYYALKHLILEVYQHDSEKLKKVRSIIQKSIDETASEDLIKGLFKNNLNVSKTAKDVFMHRNTINNRLEQLQIKTTLNLQMFQDAMAMFILFTAK